MIELHPLAQAMIDLKQDDVKSIVKQLIDDGVSAADIVAYFNSGMVEIGARFESGDCFIPELVIAGKIMEDAMAELKPMLVKEQPVETKGCVVIGTVQHDIHNIGKDIVAMMLRGGGFDVVDLGVNVSPQRFVEAVKNNDATIVALSVLLTTGYQSVTNTITALREAGLRDKVNVILGGAAASEMLAEKTGCDVFGKTAIDAVRQACLAASIN
ncbi:MAG: cobalamin-dependent protein [Candidatus Hinthialibacter antarcticus]|nr:cobalamin-dependent protein [Candidatus Hinthialibacter antarcticus]